MLNDLVELATTVVHPDHEPDIAGSSSKMPRRRQGSKSQSISSAADVNGMLPPPTPASKSGTPARKPRSRSMTNPPGSPKPNMSVAYSTAPQSRSESIARYLGAVVISTTAEGVLTAVASQFVATGELAAIADSDPTLLLVAGVLSWKLFMLTFFWFGGFDSVDVASLILLMNTPTNVLLAFFYEIRPTTLMTTTVISMFSNALPYLILRPLLPFHTPSRPASKVTLRNRPILTDPLTTIATSLLATAIFAVLLQLSFTTYLPTFMISRFENLRSFVFAHEGAAGLPILLAALLPSGYACTEYLFTPSTAATPYTAPDFDPATSGFLEHVYWNAWGWYSARQRMLIFRATVLAALMSMETIVFTWGSMKGVELVGALGYAGVWAAGVAVLTITLDWVGGPSD